MRFILLALAASLALSSCAGRSSLIRSQVQCQESRNCNSGKG